MADMHRPIPVSAHEVPALEKQLVADFTAPHQLPPCWRIHGVGGYSIHMRAVRCVGEEDRLAFAFPHEALCGGAHVALRHLTEARGRVLLLLSEHLGGLCVLQ